jgi:hypothetical protein
VHYAANAMMEPYRTASEVNTFLFCHRAWAFQREGAPSAREPERTVGAAYHVKHSERVTAGERTGGLARALLVIAVVLLILGLLAAVS